MVPPVAFLSGKKRQQHQLHATSSDGEHRQQPAPASNISKRRRHSGEDNNAILNEQQPLPPPSLFSDWQQRLHASWKRITARALKFLPTAMNTKKQVKSSGKFSELS
uniref:Putative ovule protein n=1 Tax=Solanum chacoense TaxID=4108 RepID=A0A0V0HPH9_SOLCH